MPKKSLIFIITILFSIVSHIDAQTARNEFRGVWVASVANLDWPSARGLSVEEQKQSLDSLFEYLASLNFNAIIFQVRPECDALYQSDIEPWSYWLTGKQGKAPEPFYDPLSYAVEKAHSLGLELHAWLNPYRAVKKTGQYELSPKHVALKHPEWIIQIGDFKFLDPGLPAVRNYVTSIVEDIVKRYDIDGIHFDDYFYPYTPHEITNEDSATFAEYPRGFTSLEDWRRDNVNLLISSVNKAVKKIKPFVRFGVSPFGIYRNNTPEGISGYSSVDKIYCDPIAWIKDKSIDYLSPQLYWAIGGSQDYYKLLKWWNDQSNGIEIIPGIAVYKIISKSWDSSEIPEQIRYARKLPNVGGTIIFRAGNLFANPANFSDSLTQTIYSQKVLPANFYSRVIPSPPKYAFYKSKNDSIIELYNFSNYTGKFAAYDSSGNMLGVSYNSSSELNIDYGKKIYLKNISRYDAVNGKSIELYVTKEQNEFYLQFPVNNQTITKEEITPKFNTTKGIKFAIIETAKDANFSTELNIYFADHPADTAKIKFSSSGKYYLKAIVVDENGKAYELPPIMFFAALK